MTSPQGIASVQFSNIQSAAYAKEKLHGFEYPPGHRLIVKFDPSHDMMYVPPRAGASTSDEAAQRHQPLANRPQGL